MYPLTIHGNCLFVDNSTLQVLGTCPRKGLYKFLAKLRPSRPRAALIFGSAMHKALETRDLSEKPMVDSEVEEKMIDSLCEYYTNHPVDDTDYRSLAYAIDTVREYNRKYPFDSATPIHTPDGVLAVEIPCALPVGEITVDAELLVVDPEVNGGLATMRHIDTLTIIFTGKIDRICTYNGSIYILDHKTTSMGGPTYFDEFYTSLQFKGYKWGAEQILGKPIAGVIINALVCRPPKKDFSVNYSFDRQVIPINNEHLEDWKHSFLGLINTFINYHIDQPHLEQMAFPMNTSSCVGKYGRCDFFDVCQLPPSHRVNMLNTPLFEHDDWSPLNEDSPSVQTIKQTLPGLW